MDGCQVVKRVSTNKTKNALKYIAYPSFKDLKVSTESDYLMSAGGLFQMTS